MRCPICGRSDYVTSSGYCLICNNKVNKVNDILQQRVKENNILFWSDKVDYVFYTPFFEEFFNARGYKREFFEELRSYYCKLFDNKIVGKGYYKDEPFLYFEQNFSLNPWKKSFQLMFFKRDKKRRYMTYVTEALSGGFCIIPYERDSVGTVLVEGPLDCVSLSFIFLKYNIPLRVFTGFGVHRTMELVKSYWPLLEPIMTFFDKDIMDKQEVFLYPGFEFLYNEFGSISDPDDLLRVDLNLEKFMDRIRSFL